jgi:hypothetical protein
MLSAPIPSLVAILASLVLFTSGVLLIASAATAYIRPALAKRVLMSFASSARAHYLEQGLRLVLGGSIVVLSPGMWQATAFTILGWSIVLSSVVLMILPWRAHRRLAEHMLPPLARHLRLFAFAVFVFGALLLFALSTSLRQSPAVQGAPDTRRTVGTPMGGRIAISGRTAQIPGVQFPWVPQTI